MSLATPADIFAAEWRAMLAARRRRIFSLLILALLLSGVALGPVVAEPAATWISTLYAN